MASNAIIGALRVVLGADTAALEKGLKNAQKQVSGFSGGMAKAGAVAAAAFVSVGTAMALAMRGAINDADNLGKAAQKWGVPVEELSALKHAADLSGISLESLGQGMGRLSKSMVEAAAKPTSEAANAFKALGVSVLGANGQIKPTMTMLSDIAGRFEGLKDGAGKTAVAMAIFGKSGADLIPLLNSGKDGLAAMILEAGQLGIVIDSKTAKAAENFNDNLTRLSRIKEGIIVQVTARMVPALENLSQVMIDGAKNSKLMDEAAKVLTVTLQGVVSVAITIGAALKIAVSNIATIGQALWQAAKGDFAGAWDTIKSGMQEAASTMVGAGTAIRDIWVGSADGANKAAASTATATKAQREFNYAALGGKSAATQFLEAQQRSVAAMMADAQTTGMAAGAKERLRFMTEAYAAAAAKGIVPTEAMRIALSGLGGSAELAAMKMANMSLLGSNDPLAALRLQIDETNAKLAQGGLSAQDYATLSGQATELTAKYWQGMGTSVAGSLGQAAQAFGEHSKTMAKVAKAAGIVQATIAMWQAGAEAIKLGFPQGLAASAVMIAKGAAIVSSIRGINVGGFATGGSFTVPGGIGGGDRVRAVMNLEPGERVDVWRPGEGPDPRRGAMQPTPSINITLHGENYSRPQIEKLINGINDAIGDGFRLKVQTA